MSLFATAVVFVDATGVIGCRCGRLGLYTNTVATLTAAARPEDAAIPAGLRLPIRRDNFLRAAVEREEKGRGSKGPAAMDRDAGG